MVSVMAVKIPFVVQPNLKPVKEQVGTETSGKIEIERRGYVTVSEKAFVQAATEGDDSQGRLFVADRGNNRIQIFDQDGELIDIWTQFGRPSGIWIDENDKIFVADGMSGEQWNRGWERGIRIGDARTGYVTEFIPDYEIPNGSGIEFLASDYEGNIYAGQVGRQRFEKYERVRP